MEKAEFLQQFERNQKALRRFLTALCCGDSFTADDLAQDTSIKAFLALDRLREEEKFTQWLFRIAYTTFLNHTSAKRVYSEISTASLTASDYRADSGFEYQHLYCALSQLSAKERYAILLHYLQGYAINEIADITRSSQSAVKKQLSRGREHLKQILIKENYEH